MRDMNQTGNIRTEDEMYMRRCIQLARNGWCNTPLNPMVGAVIVCDGRIIGEGYHVRCGEAHAEVNAIRSVADPSLLRRSTLYVSLEPCSHYGKTPPCADLVIEKGIPRIVAGCLDPFPEVAGRGLAKLREAGREVVTGVCEEECRALISRFVTYYTRHRPYVTLKWAESADGFIDRQREDGRPAILSSPLSAMLVHKLRAEHMAIMVGTRTALLDDPSLTVRHWYGRQPLRVVIDRKRRLPRTLHLFDGSVPTLVVTQSPPPARAKRLPGVEYLVLDYSRDILPQLMLALHSRNIQSLLVEGGRELLQSFLRSGLWDEAFVEESPLRLGSGVEAPAIDKKNFCETVQHFGRYIRHYRAQ